MTVANLRLPCVLSKVYFYFASREFRSFSVSITFYLLRHLFYVGYLFCFVSTSTYICCHQDYITQYRCFTLKGRINKSSPGSAYSYFFLTVIFPNWRLKMFFKITHVCTLEQWVHLSLSNFETVGETKCCLSFHVVKYLLFFVICLLLFLQYANIQRSSHTAAKSILLIILLLSLNILCWST